MKWAVGVITAPRTGGYYLDRTISSLQSSGWDQILVFAEPQAPVTESSNVQVIRRRKKYGDWTNWATGLYELFLSEPDSDYYFMLEDDALLCSGAKEYLEYALPKLEEFGSFSLYTPSRYHKANRARCFHDECRGKLTWSTVTVVMPHRSVLSFFSDENVQKHRFSDIFQVKPEFWHLKASYGAGRTSVTDCVGNTIKDAVIGQWAERKKLPMYYHTPSLAEHIGIVSTLTDDDSTPENGRMSRDFVGEKYDVSSWVGQPVSIHNLAKLRL
jgi:hypothetical protein